MNANCDAGWAPVPEKGEGAWAFQCCDGTDQALLLAVFASYQEGGPSTYIIRCSCGALLAISEPIGCAHEDLEEGKPRIPGEILEVWEICGLCESFQEYQDAILGYNGRIYTGCCSAVDGGASTYRLKPCDCGRFRLRPTAIQNPLKETSDA